VNAIGGPLPVLFGLPPPFDLTLDTGVFPVG
jgi:hypothetical protein